MVAETNKRVVVIGDNDLACKAIKLALRSKLRLAMTYPEQCDAVPSSDGGAQEWDLIILAVTLEDTEPIVELAKAHMIKGIGRIPLLIVSSRPFTPLAEHGISHLRFPFDPEQLCDRVNRLFESWGPLPELR